MNYLYHDEERHWQEADKPAHDHIFIDIIRVAQWLDASANKSPPT